MELRTFIFAGHETTSGAICRTLHLLSLNQDVQEKLRGEVSRAILEHGDLPYDVLMGLPYLDAVCRETLRAFPPVPTVRRMYVFLTPPFFLTRSFTDSFGSIALRRIS